jgi:hypothetical protein
LAKVACHLRAARYGGQDGAFADIDFVTARKRRDFCGLQGRIK